jgi:hypothetical protein
LGRLAGAAQLAPRAPTVTAAAAALVGPTRHLPRSPPVHLPSPSHVAQRLLSPPPRPRRSEPPPSRPSAPSSLPEVSSPPLPFPIPSAPTPSSLCPRRGLELGPACSPRSGRPWRARARPGPLPPLLARSWRDPRPWLASAPGAACPASARRSCGPLPWPARPSSRRRWPQRGPPFPPRAPPGSAPARAACSRLWRGAAPGMARSLLASAARPRRGALATPAGRGAPLASQLARGRARGSLRGLLAATCAARGQPVRGVRAAVARGLLAASYTARVTSPSPARLQRPTRSTTNSFARPSPPWSALPGEDEPTILLSFIILFVGLIKRNPNEPHK